MEIEKQGDTLAPNWRHSLKQNDIPTLPLVARKLVELCRDENVSFSELALVLESDPGLASRILRVANSAFYGLRHKATSLKRAITSLGLKYVKTIALGFHLTNCMNHIDDENFDLEKFWRFSIIRGVFARQIAEKTCPDRRDEAFLIGLLQDSGIIFLSQVLGTPYIELWNKHSSPVTFYRLEKELFPIDHVQAMEMISNEWSLPALLARPMSSHHVRSQDIFSLDENIQLDQIAYFVGSLAFHDPEKVSPEDITLKDYAQRAFTFTDEDIDDLFTRTRQEYNNISQFYSNIISDQIDITDLLNQTRQLLCDMAGNTPREMLDLENEVHVLRQSCEKYRRLAETDELTELNKRSALEHYLKDALAKIRNGQTTLSVMFIDVDDFRQINNRFGHAAGDYLLQELARLFVELFHNAACLCRYGGDEFIIAILGPKPKQSIKMARLLADRIRKIDLPPIMVDAKSSPAISCSIGLVICEPNARVGTVERLLELADNQMYRVKKQGKDGFQYEIVPSPDEPTY